jgi:hypothetical protein
MTSNVISQWEGSAVTKPNALESESRKKIMHRITVLGTQHYVSPQTIRQSLGFGLTPDSSALSHFDLFRYLYAFDLTFGAFGQQMSHGTLLFSSLI